METPPVPDDRRPVELVTPHPVIALGGAPPSPMRREHRPHDRAMRAGSREAARSPWVVGIVGGAIALGIFLRLWLVSNTGVNSDEAVVGLIAKGALHGHFNTFYWGQTYGGVEPYGVALFFAVFGAQTWLLHVVPALLDATGCLLLWRLGRRAFNPTVGAVGAALAWMWPESDIRNSVQELGFRGVVLVCGVTALLCATIIAARQDRPLVWGVLGTAAGLGWWASPEILYFLGPAAVAVAWSLVWSRRSLRWLAVDLPVLLVCFGVSASPWLYTNINSHFSSLRTGAYYGTGTYLARLETFFSKTLPITFGTRVIGTGAWLGGRAGPLVFGLILAVVVASIVVVAWRIRPARILVVFLAGFPFLYAAFPTDYWRDARFAVDLAPVLALVVVGALYDVTARGRSRFRSTSRRWALTAGALVTAGGVSTVASIGLTTSFDARPFAIGSEGVESVPLEVVAGLRHHGITHVYAQYWVAYVVDLVSNGTITATPPDAIRSTSLFAAVTSAPRATWLFTGPTTSDSERLLSSVYSDDNPYRLTPAQFRRVLRQGHVASNSVAVGPMTAVTPDVQVTPKGLYRLETKGHL